MVTAPTLAPQVLNSIANQIAERVPRSSELAAPGAVAGIGESLRVALLPEDELTGGKGALGDRVVETGQWHHQIYTGDDARSFARSIEAPEAPGEPSEVVEVADSVVAADLGRTIRWVDENVPQEGEAEVLMVPSHFTVGLWLHGPELDAVVVSSAPPEMELPRNRLIESGRFIEMLAARPAIEGLGARDGSAAPLGEGA
ncbi:hypothetical protein [Novosphingobium sp. BW1]|uniref:hypothetical protein n=1 Tax=Novosphingobium sp. BW1 TaxID=2592621 RepID=UPI0011DEF1BB|nr:hypothetical protein [Novosphingobium sp. BW1]TYC78768.1 hypothetical protein FMM79_20695 [Novosphingobium sp. BW1]